jgi:hypothetical protein
MSEMWEEPGGGVRVEVEPTETIIVVRGRVDVAEVVTDTQSTRRPRRFRPAVVAARYRNIGGSNEWSYEVTIGGPSVLSDGRPGNDYHYATYHPGAARPPFWAAAFATAHLPVLGPDEDPEVTLTDAEIDRAEMAGGLPPELDAP